MAEQTTRFKGLRRIVSAQEGLRSPSYKTHNLFFNRARFVAGEREIITIETEATDLVYPVTPAQLAPNGLYGLLALHLRLNDSTDIIHLEYPYNHFHIRNFPMYKFSVQIHYWPQETPQEFLEQVFYTFTNPRIIEDIK